MTNDKEKLRKKFNEFYYDEAGCVIRMGGDAIFEFFYSEIEAQKLLDYKRMQEALLACHTLRSDSEEKFTIKLKSQSEIIQAADEVIEKSKNLCTYTTYPRHKESYKQALEKYSSLKEKNNGKISCSTEENC